MFENVIGQNAVVSLLAHDLKNRRLPSAILIDGPRFSGKGTIALETARVLSCRAETGAWDCDCHACRLHREIEFPELATFGPRDFVGEISVSADAVKRDPRRARRFLFVRSVRRLVLRFDPRFQVGKRDTTVANAVEQLMHLTAEFVAGDAGASEVNSAVDAIVELATSLERKLPNDHFPVDRIRALAAWMRVSGVNGSKTVILEEAHTMQASAQNALLKILEEPPDAAYIILCSSRPSALAATVLSRLRRFTTIPRSDEAEAEVLKRLFSIEQYDGGLKRFFRDATLANGDEFAVVVGSLRGFIHGEPVDGDQATDAFRTAAERGDGKTVFIAAAEEAARSIRLTSTTAEEREAMQRRWAALRRHTDRVTTRNINPTATFRSLVFTSGGQQ